jgi:hypothetical protein
MVDQSKRTFCRKYFASQIGNVVEGFRQGIKEAKENLTFDEFFESYGSSYALTLAYPDDILLETARQHGIVTDGREKNEIVKELFEKHGGYGHSL